MSIAHRDATLRSRTRRDRTEFRLLFWASFAVFVIAGLVARLSPGHWLGQPSSHGVKRQSLLAEARAAAGATVPFAFMG